MSWCSKSIVLKDCQANSTVSTRKRLILYLEWVYTVSIPFSERAGMWTSASFMLQCLLNPRSEKSVSTKESLNSELWPAVHASPQKVILNGMFEMLIGFFLLSILMENANMLWALLFTLKRAYIKMKRCVLESTVSSLESSAWSAVRTVISRYVLSTFQRMPDQ